MFFVRRTQFRSASSTRPPKTSPSDRCSSPSLGHKTPPPISFMKLLVIPHLLLLCTPTCCFHIAFIFSQKTSVIDCKARASQLASLLAFSIDHLSRAPPSYLYYMQPPHLFGFLCPNLSTLSAVYRPRYLIAIGPEGIPYYIYLASRQQSD